MAVLLENLSCDNKKAVSHLSEKRLFYYKQDETRSENVSRLRNLEIEA
jgi:hypothetical protein